MKMFFLKIVVDIIVILHLFLIIAHLHPTSVIELIALLSTYLILISHLFYRDIQTFFYAIMYHHHHHHQYLLFYNIMLLKLLKKLFEFNFTKKRKRFSKNKIQYGIFNKNIKNILIFIL